MKDGGGEGTRPQEKVPSKRPTLLRLKQTIPLQIS